ncbi:unnamed protein product [Microthlaspi erraticum]|uniref:RING-type E3 ubiquitin transferase n=1 Tax=Microthlaspi erraticum TaxID=1685480 RepID=A0A6D2K8V0_9BRAS|nr:unnamed protein product [Microthlaspi erraticum]
MGDPTADSTAANAETLKQELKKLLTEILSNGGEMKDRVETDASSGALKAIDEAIRILNRLREVELKTPESDIPSSPPSPKVKVPKEFICTLSNQIMIEPVVIASGQTYEKRCITPMLMNESKCPKTKKDLSNTLWTPNHLADEMITQWCQANDFDRPKPSDETVAENPEMCKDGIESLLERISSPSSSLQDQTEAAKSLRYMTKKYLNDRVSFVAGFPNSITRLLTPLSALADSNSELQEHLVTTLFNISVVDKTRTVIAENPLVIPLLTKSLKQGTVETRRNSASALLSLSAIDSNKIILGKPEVIKALIDVIEEGDFLVSREAANTAYNICTVSPENLIRELMMRINGGSNADVLLSVLAMISAQECAVKMMLCLGFIRDLFTILRKSRCSKTCEHALVVVYNMCMRDKVATRMKVVNDEENQYGTFTKLAKQGSDGGVKIAKSILRWLKIYGTGKHPQTE